MSDVRPLRPRPSRLARDEFISAYGAIYEASPWVAENLWPQASTGAIDHCGAMAAAMRRAVDEAAFEAKVQLIRAHPDLAGKTALAGELTGASRREQAAAGLDQCSPEEFAAFQELNAAYRDKFGFPFVIAVRKLDRQTVLEALRNRLSNTLQQEFETAIAEIHAIAGFRLRELTTDK